MLFLGRFHPLLVQLSVGGLVVLGLATFLLHQRGLLKAYRCSLAGTLFLMGLVIYVGSGLSDGRGFLTRHAPGSFRAWVGRDPCPPLQQPVFAGIIEPILRERCVACHGAEKHKGDLRLDTMEELLRGGQDGLVIKPGHADDSPLIQCLLSPVEADGHMPPEEQPQATTREIALLVWWINAGAPAEQKVCELKPEPEVRRLIGVVSNPNESAK
jgi:hypothetical protein